MILGAKRRVAGPVLRRPVLDALGRPCGVLRWAAGMCAGSVVARPLRVAACVQRDALALVVDLDGALVEEELDLSPDEVVGHRVAVAADLDVVVDVHLGGLAGAVEVGLGGSGRSSGSLALEEHASP